MSERDIFTAALEMTEPSERSVYLDQVCADDGALRQRVEMLLGTHGRAGDFLERPAAEPIEAGAAPAQDSTAIHGPACRAEPGDDEEDAPLDFLLPSTKPGSLGRLGHYEVLEVLGRGGFGIVLRAFDDLLHRVVAVKVMAPRLAATSPARKRFLREARASAAIRHENVVAIYNVEEQPIPYLVMEFIAGETIQEKLDRLGPLDAAETARIGRQIAEGLAAAHAMGLIHRDVKPSNILLESGTDRVKITDFGLARAADDASLTQSGVIAGTPMYMAPEQALGEVIDHRADLFSLGSVLYVMCSGRPPFRASTTMGVLKRVAEDMPRPIREIIPEVPEWLCAIIAKLHAKKPEDRFASAKEVADLLARRLAEPQPRNDITSSPSEPATHRQYEQPHDRLEPSPVDSPAGLGVRLGGGWMRRRTKLLLLIATLLAIGAGAAVWLVWLPPWAKPLEKRLLGSWEGSGKVSMAWSFDVTPDPAHGVPGGKASGWSEVTATVWVHFEPNGTYTFMERTDDGHGSTMTFSIPKEGSSPPRWEVVHAEGNKLTVRMAAQEAVFDFQGENAFTQDTSGPQSHGIITFHRSGSP